MAFRMDRRRYNSYYGPTAGDRLRLGDTALLALVERDFTPYGDEVLRGWAKNLRAGMMVAPQITSASALDVVISNVVVMDPVLGIFKGCIGIKEGLIAGVGRAGNPDIMDGVDLVIGPNTVLLPGDGLIATPGAVDSHVHLYFSPRIALAGLAAGVTTFIGAGTIQTGRTTITRYLQAYEALPVNLGLQARGSTVSEPAMEESLEAGACGFKIHEDEGAYPEVIERCLRVAEAHDVSVALHTDGLQESLDVQGTVEAIGGRTVHAYHIEGAGGGHAPDLLALVSVPNIIPSSTTPTNPYTISTAEEHRAMTVLPHNLNWEMESDMEALRLRLRPYTMAAEDVLHDMGAIPIINSDSQGMGRIGELVARTWQLAHKMKLERGPGAEQDNRRILRYLAKYTINPAIVHGIANYVGSLERGKMADIVLWRPALFGVKPELVIKGGFPAWGAFGEGNASVAMVEPVLYGPGLGGLGRCAPAISAFFVSQRAVDSGLAGRLGTARRLLPVRNCRGVTRRDMLHNTATPRVEVDGEAGRVLVDGQEVHSEALREVPLNRLYTLA